MRNLLDSCAGKTEARLAGCPFGSTLAESRNLQNIKSSVEQYPQITLAESVGDSYSYGYSEPNVDGNAWNIVTEEYGEALITGRYKSWDEMEDFDNNVQFSVRGAAEIVDGKVVINVEEDSQH